MRVMYRNIKALINKTLLIVRFLKGVKSALIQLKICIYRSMVSMVKEGWQISRSVCVHINNNKHSKHTNDLLSLWLYVHHYQNVTIWLSWQCICIERNNTSCNVTKPCFTEHPNTDIPTFGFTPNMTLGTRVFVNQSERWQCSMAKCQKYIS